MKKTVLLAGANIAGLSLAYWLNRCGYKVTVVEISPGLRKGGASIDVRGEALAVAERMGILDKIKANKITTAVEFVDAQNQCLAAMKNFGEDALGQDIELATRQNTTADGEIHQNKYCWVCRINTGKIYELKEYMDTDLVTKTFTEASINIFGEKFLFDFGMNKDIIHFLNKDFMEFTITEKAGIPAEETEKVEIKLSTIRPNVYLATWKEKNKNTVTQVQDFQNKTVYSNWTLPNGDFINVNGTICPSISAESPH